MRKISIESCRAFLDNKKYSKGNMSVKDNMLFLHTNCIAKKENGQILISNAGWTSTVTKERLNALLSMSGVDEYIQQKDFEWYLISDNKRIPFPYNEFFVIENAVNNYVNKMLKGY